MTKYLTYYIQGEILCFSSTADTNHNTIGNRKNAFIRSPARASLFTGDESDRGGSLTLEVLFFLKTRYEH